MASSIIDKTCKFVEDKLSGDGSGHDWWHIFRVWTLAKKIALEEKAQLEIVELGALLHDIADWKFHDGDDSIGPEIAREFLNNHDVEPNLSDSVVEIISTVSYKGAGVATPMKTLEGKIVQDADRLDAIGALGIAEVSKTVTSDASGNITFVNGTNDIDIASHDAGTNGLKLGGTLVTKSATDINNLSTDAEATAVAVSMAIALG